MMMEPKGIACNDISAQQFWEGGDIVVKDMSYMIFVSFFFKDDARGWWWLYLFICDFASNILL